MLNIVKTCDRLACFLVDPANSKYSSSRQRLAWATTILMGIATLGCIQIMSILWRKWRLIQAKNETQEKIHQLFQKIIKGKSDEQKQLPLAMPLTPALSDDTFLTEDKTKNLSKHLKLLEEDEIEPEISPTTQFAPTKDTSHDDKPAIPKKESNHFDQLPFHNLILNELNESLAPEPVKEPVAKNKKTFQNPPQIQPKPIVIEKELDFFDQLPFHIFDLPDPHAPLPAKPIEEPIAENKIEPKAPAKPLEPDLIESSPQPSSVIPNLFLLMDALRKAGTNIHVEVEGVQFILSSSWLTDKSAVINIQDKDNHQKRNHDNKLGLVVNKAGELLSMSINNVPQENQLLEIPVEFMPQWKACFAKALKMTSTYENVFLHENGREILNNISIELLRRGLQDIPEFHLTQFSELLAAKLRQSNRFSPFATLLQDHLQLDGTITIEDLSNSEFKEKINKSSSPKTSVHFLKDNLQYDRSIDAGGPSRDYFDDLFAGIMKSQALRFQTTKTSLFMPRTKEDFKDSSCWPKLNAEEQSLYQKMGQCIMFCHNSPKERLLLIGHHFDSSLFKAAFSLKAEEINTPFNELPFATKLKIFKSIVEAQEETMYDSRIALLEKEAWTNQELQKAAQQAIYAECLPEEFVQADDSPDMEKIKAYTTSEKLIRNAVIDSLFGRSNNQGIYSTQLAPIHAIAQGMKSIYDLLFPNKHTANHYWNNTFLNTNYHDFSTKIQGSIDRQKIVDSFEISFISDANQKMEITKKTNWLKEWLMDAEKGATEEEVRKFIKFVTGCSTLQDKKPIAIRSQSIEKLTSIPSVHTCHFVIELSPVPVGNLESYNDFTKENFIKGLREIAFTQLASYSIG